MGCVRANFFNRLVSNSLHFCTVGMTEALHFKFMFTERPTLAEMKFALKVVAISPVPSAHKYPANGVQEYSHYPPERRLHLPTA